MAVAKTQPMRAQKLDLLDTSSLLRLRAAQRIFKQRLEDAETHGRQGPYQCHFPRPFPRPFPSSTTKSYSVLVRLARSAAALVVPMRAAQPLSSATRPRTTSAWKTASTDAPRSRDTIRLECDTLPADGFWSLAHDDISFPASLPLPSLPAIAPGGRCVLPPLRAAHRRRRLGVLPRPRTSHTGTAVYVDDRAAYVDVYGLRGAYQLSEVMPLCLLERDNKAASTHANSMTAARRTPPPAPHIQRLADDVQDEPRIALHRRRHLLEHERITLAETAHTTRRRRALADAARRTPITTNGARLPPAGHTSPLPRAQAHQQRLGFAESRRRQASTQMHTKTCAAKGASSTSRTHAASASASAHDEILIGPLPPAPHGLVEDVQYEPDQRNSPSTPSPAHHERLTHVKDAPRLVLPDTASTPSAAYTLSSTHAAFRETAPRHTTSVSPKWCKTIHESSPVCTHAASAPKLTSQPTTSGGV
ncbi:hypothetical protein DFH06DRAFT_1488580 [Mycena polygramma]|nr:hypothetical protein DFH06DRAFT_1488580 [Mycena polygramma]